MTSDDYDTMIASVLERLQTASSDKCAGILAEMAALEQAKAYAAMNERTQLRSEQLQREIERVSNAIIREVESVGSVFRNLGRMLSTDK